MDEGSYQELLKTDQLHKEMAAKRAFLGFTEVRKMGGSNGRTAVQLCVIMEDCFHHPSRCLNKLRLL